MCLRQVLLFIVVSIMGALDLNVKDRQSRLVQINNFATGMTTLITVVNTVLNGFGISRNPNNDATAN